MKDKINPPIRMHSKLVKDMEELMRIRVSNGLLNIKEAKMPKMTELLTRTQGYQLSLKELKIKREKK